MSKGAFKGWKKVHSAKDHSVMRNDEGHELRIAHSGLSPKMRGQLAEIPVHQEAEDSNPAGKESTTKNKGTLKMSDGGKAWSQSEKEDFAKGASGGGSAPAAKPASASDRVTSHQEPSEDEKHISSMQSANKADPSKADALAKTNAARANYKAPFAEGGEVQQDELIPGIPSEASNPNQYNFEQKQQELKQSMQGNYPNPQALDQASASKALDQMDSEKEAGAAAAAQVGAEQGAAFQQAADLNKRLVSAGQNPLPMPGAPAGGVPEQDQGVPSAPPSAMGGSQGPGGAPQAAPSNADPYGIQTGTDMYRSGYNQQLGGIGQEAKATGALGTAQAQIEAQAATNQQKLMNDFNTHMANYQAQSEEAIKALEDPKSGIDANHYMGSMDTGQRISSAIGLILGGMGAGLTGGPNVALEMLNNNINRDIEAQKSNLGTKKSLLEFNMQRMNNMREATMMTNGMMKDLTARNLQAAADAAQDPIAKARAMQAAGQLKQQASNNFRQLAMQKTMMGGMANGTVSPAMAVEYSPMLDPTQRTAARKELKDMQDAVALRDNTLSAFDHISKLQTIGGRLSSPLQSTRQIEAIQGPVLDQLTKDTSGRVTPETVKLVKGAFGRMGNSKETNDVARHTIDNLLSQKMNYPTLTILGIKPQNFSRFNSQGASTVPMRAPVPNKKK
jgi:hypothetical protein